MNKFHRNNRIFERHKVVFENITTLTEGVKIKGRLVFPGSVKIDGEITGDIEVGGNITIGRNAKLLSNIKTKGALISGYIKGDIHSLGQVEITSTGRFIGNLIQDKTLLSVEKGGMFKGRSISNNGDEYNRP